MKFERRDFILVAASIFLMLGLAPFIGIAYSLAVAFLVYFGIKVFVGRRKQQMLRDAGAGFCAECGTKIVNDTCPSCNPDHRDV